MENKPNKTSKLLEAINNLDIRKTKIESIPSEISSESIKEIDEWNKSNENIPKSIDKNDPTVVYIGFDFGTSSTKVIVRLPYLENKTSAFPVPLEFRMNDHPHLWKTLVYFNNKTSEFSLYPQKGFIEITNIKTILMDTKKHYKDFAFCEKTKIYLQIEEVTIAYFALLLRLIKGWAYVEAFKPENTLSSNSILQSISKWFSPQTNTDQNYEIKNPLWHLNVGFPASNLDNKKTKLKKIYERIIKKAWILSCKQKKITFENIQKEKELDDTYLYNNFNLTISILPEVCAEIIGLLRQGKHKYGQYLIVDIGASTLDVCFMDYNSTFSSGTFALDKCLVKLLGSELKSWCSGLEDFSETDLIEAIRSSIVKVVSDAYKDFKDQHTYKIWKNEETLPLILCGGGTNNSLHKKAIKEAEKSISNQMVRKGVEHIIFEKPNEIKADASNLNFHRLSVAWGLSFENSDLIKIFYPSEQTPVRYKKKDLSINYIGPEHI